MFTEAGLEGLARGDNPRAPASRQEAELEAKLKELTAALGEAYVELRLWRKKEGSIRRRGIRLEEKVPFRRFCRRLGIPPSTWYDWRAAHLAGRLRKRWRAPVVEAIAEPAAAQAHRWSAWGHRRSG
jgi:hypothetical protein